MEIIKKSEINNFFMNIFYFGIGSLGTNIIAILLLPLITTTYSVEEFGNYDLSFTIASIISVFIVFGLQDGLFRFMFSEKYTKEEVLSNTFSLICINGIVVSFFYLCFFKFFFGKTFDENFPILLVLVFILFIVNAFQSFFLSFLRVENKSKKVVSMSFIQSFSFLILFLIFSKFINMPVYSLLISHIIANVLSYTFLFAEVKYIFKSVHFKLKKNLTLDLIKFSAPLIIVFSGYWVLSSSDKFLINHYLSIKEVGLYSAAAKLGGLLNVLQTVFGTAWQYFSYETMNNDNKVKVYSMFLEIIIMISSLLIIFIILFSDYLTSIIFSVEYYSIWIIIPILCFSPICMVLMWILSVGSNFSNKTYLGLISVGSGALINILLNIIFIPLYGILAASITTLISYFIMVAISYLLNRKILNIRINFFKVFPLIVILTIVYFVKIYWFEMKFVGSISLFIIFILILASINFTNLKLLKTKFKKKIKKDLF